MATEVTIEFSGDDDENRKRNLAQPASEKGQADGVSSRKRNSPSKAKDAKTVAEPSRAELVQQAKNLEIRGYSAMNKTQLQEAINLKLTPPKGQRKQIISGKTVHTTSDKFMKTLSEGKMETWIKDSAINPEIISVVTDGRNRFVVDTKAPTTKAQLSANGFKQQKAKTSKPSEEPAPAKPEPVKLKSRTRTDSKGRVWTFNDAEGSWVSGNTVIGMGAKNKAKFQVWDGPNKGYDEYKTLSEAIESVGSTNFPTPEKPKAKIRKTKKPKAKVESQPKVEEPPVTLSETYLPEGEEYDTSFDFGANVKDDAPLFDQDATEYSPLPEPVAQTPEPELNSDTPLFDQDATDFSPLPEPTAKPEPEAAPELPLIEYGNNNIGPPDPPITATGSNPDDDDEEDTSIPGPDSEPGPPNVTFVPKSPVPFDTSPSKTRIISEKERKKLEADVKKQQLRQNRSSLSQMQRRANVQNSIQKRRETLRRRREREAITENARQAKSSIRETYDRGDADRLVRRLATFGIGRAVGIDGGIITALAEILVFQPEINRAEAEVSNLLQSVDRDTAERMQELERSKTATTERRLNQSIDIAETIDDARMRVANGEEIDISEVEAQIEAILNRGVVDPGTGIPDPRTGQQPGPATDVFPVTSEYITLAEAGMAGGASGMPPGTTLSGSGPVNTQGPPGTPPRGNFGGSGGGNMGGFGGVPPIPPAGGAGQPPIGNPPPGNPGGGPSGLTMTTSALLRLTVGLTAAAKASEVVTEGFKSVGELLQNENNVGKAVTMAGSVTSASTTGVSTLAGFALGGPVGALGGLVVGKAIGSIIIKPITEAITTGFDLVSNFADRSLGPATIGARASENIELLLTQLEESLKIDDLTAEYVEARTEFAKSIMELKTSIIKIIGPAATDMVKLLTTLVEGVDVAFLKGPGQAPGEVSTTQGMPTMTYNLMRIIGYLQGIKDNTDPQAESNDILGPINDFFMGGSSNQTSMAGSLGRQVGLPDITNNLNNFNP